MTPTMQAAPSRRILRPESLVVRPWRRGDTDAINALYNDAAVRPAAAGVRPRTGPQWEWEFLESASGEPAYIVAECGGRIVGLQGYIPIEFVRDGQVVLTGKDEDTLIHPDFRGIGLLEEMYRQLFDHATARGVQVLWGFTRTATRALQRSGYRSICRFESMRAELQPAGGLHSLCRFLQGRRGEPVEVERDPGLRIEEVHRTDERFDEFSMQLGRRLGGIMPHLSARFLAWRAMNNPFKAHRVLAALDGGQVIGLGVFKPDRAEATGYVSELAALPEEGTAGGEAVLGALLRAGIGLFRQEDLPFAEARPAGGHGCNRLLRKVLADHGFSSQPAASAAEFVVWLREGADPRLADYSAWRLSEIMREY
jgi:GNAT superfamily N-acetyltransferase